MRLSKFPSALANRPLRQRKARLPLLRYGLRALAAVLIILIVAIGAVIGVVLSGPTEVGLVRDRIAAMLERSLGPGYTVDVGSAVVDVDPALGLVVQVVDVSIKDSQQAIVARAPSTRLAIDPSSLLRFRLDVRTIELAGPEISFVRGEDGAVFLGNSATAHAAAGDRPDSLPNAIPGGNDGGFPDLFSAIQILDHGLKPAIDGAIESGFLRFSLVDGTIAVWDAERAQQRSFQSTDLNASVEPKTGDLKVDLVTSGFGGRWSATFDRTVDLSTGERRLSADFSELTLADVVPQYGDSASLFKTDIPLYGRGYILFATDGTVKDASMRLDLGAGIMRFGELMTETVLLDEATIKLRWDLPNKVVIVEPSPFYFGDTRGVITGTIRPEGDSAARRYAYALETRGAVLAPRDSGEPPLIAERIAVSGVADFAKKLLTFDDVVLLTPAGSIAAAGTLGFEDKSPSLAVAASFSPMSAAALKQMWIPFIAPGARRWVLAHVIGGTIASGRFEAAMPAGVLFTRERTPIPEDMMRLDIRFENASFTSFGELPPVIKASGNAVLAGSTFGVDLETGEVKTASGATVAVTAGAFAIGNTRSRASEGVIEVQMVGDAAALGEIANAKPFLTLEKRKVAPSDLSGQGDVSVSIRMPLTPGITEADIDWKVTVNATDLSSAVPVEGRVFSDADVVIGVTPDEVTVNGKAKIDGVVADVSMAQPIGSGGKVAGPGANQFRLTLDEAARKRLGIGLDEILGGTVAAVVRNLEGGRGQRYELDLKRARLMIPGLGWSKGVGVPATLSFDLRPGENGSGSSVENILLEGEGFGLSGSAKLNATYGLASADIDRFSLRPGDSVAFTLTRTQTGYAIDARGASFDMRSVINRIREAASGSSSPDLSVEARLDRMIGFNKQTISNARVSFVSTGGIMEKLVFEGAIGGQDASINYTDRSEGASLLASAGDAGGLLRFMDFYTRFEGGSLSIAGQGPGGTAPLVGTFEISDFNIVDEPAMEQVVSTTAPGGERNGIDPKRLHFTRLIAKFRKTDQSIAIDDAVLRGATVGATFNGRVNLSESRVSINGTYLPAYAFNNAFSRVPLIGVILGGGSSGGLIGVTFKIDGTLSQPRVFINPLSAVAPGIFRKIFEFQ